MSNKYLLQHSFIPFRRALPLAIGLLTTQPYLHVGAEANASQALRISSINQHASTPSFAWEEARIGYFSGDIIIDDGESIDWQDALKEALPELFDETAILEDEEFAEGIALNDRMPLALIVDGAFVMGNYNLQVGGPLMIYADSVELYDGAAIVSAGPLYIDAESFDGRDGVLVASAQVRGNGERDGMTQNTMSAVSGTPNYCTDEETEDLSCSVPIQNGVPGGVGSTGAGGAHGSCSWYGTVASEPKPGGRGGQGQTGSDGLNAPAISLTVTDYYGGTFFAHGGNGGSGGAGGDGGPGGNAACCTLGCSSGAYGGAGGNGGKGGKGGAGGAITLIYCKDHLNQPGSGYSEYVDAYAGYAGRGGAGGKGGKGGTGGCVWGCSGGAVGAGGAAGTNGTNGTPGGLYKTQTCQ